MQETVIIKSRKKESLDLGMRLIDSNRSSAKEFKCIGYKIYNNTLYLYSYSDNCDKFPYEYNLQQTIDFAWGWYDVNKKPTEKEPDTDGSTEVAFELSTEKNNGVSHHWGTFCSIRPIWFIYGK